MTGALGCLLAVSAVGIGAQEHPGEEAHGHAEEEGAHGDFKNEVALFLGNTHRSEENAFTMGVDYARVLNHRFSLGVFADYADSRSERDFILGAGIWVEFLEHAGILVGGGLERATYEGPHGDPEPHSSGEDHEGTKTHGLLRVGATYAFHFGSRGQFGLAPQVFLDVVDGHEVWVTGLALAYLF
jgi:hypothetical protein